MIPPISNEIVFIGPTSSGKSSLINMLWDCNEKVGVRETTQNIKKVYDKKITVDDTPGFDDEFNLRNPKCLY